jgi:hypothetical protein
MNKEQKKSEIVALAMYGIGIYLIANSAYNLTQAADVLNNVLSLVAGAIAIFAALRIQRRLDHAAPKITA